MNIKKPNSFARYGNDYVAPLTTIDQIVKPSGERYTDKEFELMSNVENVMFGENCAGKNLLNPTLQTTTVNGVTCTNNGDGTYTLNGTASGETYFNIAIEGNIKKGTYRLAGCPSNGGVNKYMLYMHEINISEHDYGDGVLCNIANDISLSDHAVNIKVSNGVTVNNLVFKPMITTDLSATYDNFEPYVKSLKQLTDNMDLLWTNASPTSNFGAQTVSLDLSNYKFVYIAINDRASQPNNIDNALLMNVVGQRTKILDYYASSTTYSRIITVQKNGIKFEDEHSNSYDGPIENQNLIPTYIYGIK